jgi:hypothetical protein
MVVSNGWKGGVEWIEPLKPHGKAPPEAVEGSVLCGMFFRGP